MPCDDHLIMHIQIPPHNMQVLLADFYLSEISVHIHATPTQARRVHAYYIAGIKQPEISRREGVHSSKVSVSIRRGLRNMRRCYDDLFQTE